MFSKYSIKDLYKIYNIKEQLYSRKCGCDKILYSQVGYNNHIKRCKIKPYIEEINDIKHIITNITNQEQLSEMLINDKLQTNMTKKCDNNFVINTPSNSNVDINFDQNIIDKLNYFKSKNTYTFTLKLSEQENIECVLENLIIHRLENTLNKFLGDIITKKYKNEIFKKHKYSQTYIYNYIITPLLNTLKTILHQYAKYFDKLELPPNWFIDYLNYIDYVNCIIDDINSKILHYDILIYISQDFNLDKKQLLMKSIYERNYNVDISY